MNTILYIIVPCYNEEEVILITSGLFLQELTELIQKEKISDDSRILFVNDGSKDRTWEFIEKLAEEDVHFAGISQSRNRGHQNAVWAGMMEVKGTADVVYNHADYRLVSARVLKELADFREVNLFLRGMIPLVGFKSTSVYYERHERAAGKSHYPLSKMLGLAFDGITSLSVKPLRIITGMGVGVSFLGFAGVIWAVVTEFLGRTVTGWTSTVCIVCFMGGIQLICLGVLGEYIGKIYMEVKARPRYIISERTYQKPEKRKEDKTALEEKGKV